MRRSIAGLLGLVLLAACGGSTARAQADQDRDGRKLAGAIRTAYMDGGGFQLDEQLQITGGDIPTGQALQLHATASGGVLKGEAARFRYHIQQAQQGNDYDMFVVDGRLYVKQRSASAWKATPVSATTTLFPALRLELLREAVLLAASIPVSTVSHIDAGFARKYTVRPAPDQLEQLLSLPLQGDAETQFLKTARAEVTLYLLFPGDKLSRVEVRLSGTDPSSGEKQTIVSILDLRPASVAAIQAPADATLVAPSDILG
jgi:hypothetical protein